MIFVTVGTELPFDRMIQTVDRWARNNGRSDVFAQIGNGAWKPSFVKFREFLDPSDFTESISSASVVVSHAGMGTILTCLRWGKPVLVMPRRAALGEHRTDHQLATARRLLEMGRINVAYDEAELMHKLRELDQLKSWERIGPYASQELQSTIRDFILGGSST